MTACVALMVVAAVVVAVIAVAAVFAIVIVAVIAVAAVCYCCLRCRRRSCHCLLWSMVKQHHFLRCWLVGWLFKCNTTRNCHTTSFTITQDR